MEYILVETVIHTLQHGIMLSLLALHGEVFFNAVDALKTHVLGDFNGVGAPRRNHFTSRAHVPSFDVLLIEHFGLAIEPAEFLHFVGTKGMIHAGGYDALSRG